MTEHIAESRDLTADARWNAVLERDRSADGRFVYAVSSTGIFCRPSCPSRRPLRSRVRFFDSPRDAEASGFRACRRCRPMEPAGDPWVARVAQACALIARSDTPPSLAALARRFGSSPHHFQRRFTHLLGVSPREFAEARRFDTVKRRLREQQDVTAAFLDAGYGSSSRFYEGAVPRLAMTPTTYRAGGVGQTIQYASATTRLGRVLVAATPNGVCTVSLGDDDAELQAALQKEFPRATLVPGDRAMRQWLQAVVAHLAGRRPRLELPLDVQATAFQRLVWNALIDIPAGETRTYAEVATAVGRPGAARAVARACAANRVALAVPCHRVVPASGGAGGYRWGSARKDTLLAQEQAFQSPLALESRHDASAVRPLSLDRPVSQVARAGLRQAPRRPRG
jgi:AraC family transcriptional regulator of adaptative response/methylated-DNA-[protein]-cysteine methyltransferase